MNFEKAAESIAESAVEKESFLDQSKEWGKKKLQELTLPALFATPLIAGALTPLTLNQLGVTNFEDVALIQNTMSSAAYGAIFGTIMTLTELFRMDAKDEKEFQEALIELQEELEKEKEQIIRDTYYPKKEQG